MIERSREKEKKRKSKKSERTEYNCRKWKSRNKNKIPKEEKKTQYTHYEEKVKNAIIRKTKRTGGNTKLRNCHKLRQKLN